MQCVLIVNTCHKKVKLWIVDVNLSVRLSSYCQNTVNIYSSVITSNSKQNRSTEGCSKLKRSVDMTSPENNGLNIRTNASPK